MNLGRILLATVLSASSASCVSYSSIQKADKDIYLSGATSYFVITVPFLKRCDADGQVLHCEELKEFEAPRSNRGGGGSSVGGGGGGSTETAAPAKNDPAPAKK
jgi:hypothetical protein